MRTPVRRSRVCSTLLLPIVAVLGAGTVLLADSDPPRREERRVAPDGCVLIAIPGDAFTHVQQPERGLRDRWTHVPGFTNAISS